ncbi:MAG: ATP-binding cassette domain-containing protein, partial [Sulfolobales archaeon]|nr:ATP-binding cassette domain-containing protein [Sulfolobales archaeon]
EEVRDVITVLKSMGKSVVVFEHRFVSLLKLASSVYLLKNGVLVPVDHERLRYPRGADPGSIPRLSRGSEVGSSNRYEEVLKARDVWFRYDRSGDWILKGVNLVISGRKDVVVVYGLNGSGKSTLLKLVAGYLTPMRGRIEKASHVRTIYIPQNIYLFFTEESLKKEFEVVCSRHSERESCLEAGIRRLRSLGVDEELSTSPFNLSWGQAVRAAVSVATSAGSSVVLLMDEPFTGLTYADRLSLAKILDSVNSPKILTVSNRETVSLVLPARVYEMKNGHLAEVEPEVDLEVITAAEKCRELGM